MFTYWIEGKEKMNIRNVLVIIIAIIIASAFSFGITAAMVYGICWAFGLTFSIKVVIGVWLVMGLLSGVTIKTRC